MSDNALPFRSLRFRWIVVRWNEENGRGKRTELAKDLPAHPTRGERSGNIGHYSDCSKFPYPFALRAMSMGDVEIRWGTNGSFDDCRAFRADRPTCRIRLSEVYSMLGTRDAPYDAFSMFAPLMICPSELSKAAPTRNLEYGE